VPIWTVYVIGYIGFGLVIGLGEYRLATSHRRISPRSARATALRFAFGIWVCTMTATMLAEWTKSYVGRLRPNFAERCLGSGAVPPYSDGSAGLTRVIHGNAECMGGGDLWAGAWDGRRSFPSGHAALAMGAGVYMQLWLMRYSSSSAGPAADSDHVGPRSLLASVGAVLAFAYGLYVSASRVVDNAHHVSDVVGGAGLGGWLAAAHFWRVERETARAELHMQPDCAETDRACYSPQERCAASNGLKTE
jgi:membrane-associated phospholipid phosphatase